MRLSCTEPLSIMTTYARKSVTLSCQWLWICRLCTCTRTLTAFWSKLSAPRIPKCIKSNRMLLFSDICTLYWSTTRLLRALAGKVYFYEITLSFAFTILKNFFFVVMPFRNRCFWKVVSGLENLLVKRTAKWQSINSWASIVKILSMDFIAFY